MKKESRETMCKLCHQRDDGGEDILKAKIDLGVLGQIETGLDIYIYPDGEQSVREMYLWAWHRYDGKIGESLAEKAMDINFCPMCGRDLRI